MHQELIFNVWSTLSHRSYQVTRFQTININIKEQRAFWMCKYQYLAKISSYCDNEYMRKLFTFARWKDDVDPNDGCYIFNLYVEAEVLHCCTLWLLLGRLPFTNYPPQSNLVLVVTTVFRMNVSLTRDCQLSAAAFFRLCQLWQLRTSYTRMILVNVKYRTRLIMSRHSNTKKNNKNILFM